MNSLEILKRGRLFRETPEKLLVSINAIAKTKQFAEGDTIYDLGDRVDDCYILKSGRVRFSLGYGGSASNAGAIVEERGQLFGWAALLEEQSRRIAKATCLEDVEVIALDGEELRGIFNAVPEGGYLVYKQLATLIMQDFISFAAG